MKAGVVGTLGYGLPDDLRAHSGLTTPDVVGMHRVLHRLQAEGFQWVCVEASSIGLVQGRLSGVPIEAAVFTNLSQDHLDYHGSMEAYGAAKLLLAAWPTLRFGVVNADDSFAALFQRELTVLGQPTVRVGRAKDAQCCIQSVRHVSDGLVVTVQDAEAAVELQASVQGEFNAENLVLVYGVLRALGVEPIQAAAVLRAVSAPAGRMERVVDHPCVVVDYAHTPDALERVLLALRPLAQAQQGRVIVVFGCGGDRDKTKRPLMGAIAAKWADVVVLTSDNPRSELPSQILNEIRAGMPESMDVTMIEDREQAVRWVSEMIQLNDVVLLAGKGHEQTQTIGQAVLPFSDVEVAKRFFGQEASHA
jgi:UDP-N-acetylmuramyl-tripeptide synthetase